MHLFTSKTIIKAAFSLALLYPNAGFSKSAVLEGGRVSSTPFGWVEFCKRNPADCTYKSDRDRIIKLTEKEWDKIVRINDRVNRDVTAVSDLDYFGQAEYWTYPVNGKGDCEDYVLLKRKLLKDAGFPLEALPITIVKDQKGDGHAVLTVRTDYGDFILDNQEDLVKLWHATGYKFLKRQSATNVNDWVLLNPGTADSVATAR